MALTIEEAKAFIKDADRSRQPWLTMAERSWNELKKRQRNHRLWSVTPNSIRKKQRYPAWYSIFKIRQPLLLSRVGIPIGKDTTQDGNDNIGATAAICLERLAVNLAKNFDFFDVLCTARDDFLATNFGTLRGYYERDEIKQKVKEYIEPQQQPDGSVIFVDPEGKVIESNDISQDDEGFFLEHEETIDVENEAICLEPVLYKDVYVDPDIRRWNRCNRLAFAAYYSVPEFKEIFGNAAYSALPSQNNQPVGDDEASPKRQSIKVYEYWDKYEKDCHWWAELGNDFITPQGYLTPDNEEYEEEGQTLNGLYNLENLFPCPCPLIMNSPTDEFWPIPEYYQVVEILEDIHTIFTRMVSATRSIRTRGIFDSNVEGLQEALNESAEGDMIGVPNMTQSLASSGGALTNVLQYIDTTSPITTLQQLYQSLEQRLQVLFKITGTADLLQGLTSDNTGKTLGERQIEEKYAINQIAEAQKKMAEFVRCSYHLMCEMALNNFKDASLDRYIMPHTLQPDDQQRYKAAMGMLKEQQKRFRIELETDSTIALNEQYDKQMRIELVNALTTALEKTANIAEQSPALVETELHCLKYLIQGFRQGKMFQNEITQSIDNVIKQAQDAQKQAPPFNKDEAMARIEQQKLESDNQVKQFEIQTDAQLKQAKIQSDQAIEVAKIQQTDRIAQMDNQLESYKVQSAQNISFADQQLEYQKLVAQINETQETLAQKRDELQIEMQKVGGAQQAENFRIMIEQNVAQYEQQLSAQQMQLEQYKVNLDEREKYMTEARLQSEHQLEQLHTQMSIETHAKNMMTPPAQPGPNIHVTNEAPAPDTSNVIRDPAGNIMSIQTGTKISNIKRDAMGNVVSIEHTKAK